MNGNYLLDTNIVIALFAQDRNLTDHFTTGMVFSVPSIVIGELYFGAYKSNRAVANIARIDRFRARTTILGADGATAQHYGLIKHALRLKGRPIPENDIWIAALAIQHQLTLITRDEHFS